MFVLLNEYFLGGADHAQTENNPAPRGYHGVPEAPARAEPLGAHGPGWGRAGAGGAAAARSCRQGGLQRAAPAPAGGTGRGGAGGGGGGGRRGGGVTVTK